MFVISEATRFYTRYNKLCVSECTQKKSYYWCYTGKHSRDWDYCSPRPNFDINNRPCLNNCGKKNKTSYNWCDVTVRNNKSWNYCGTHRDNFNLVASNGYFCTDECAKRGKPYYWCNTESGWQYCSPNEGIDCYSRPCSNNSYCDKRGASYYWCGVNSTESSWGYCSISSESKHVTYNGYYCSTDCLYDSSTDYFSCNIFDGSTEYCSPTTPTMEADSHGHLCNYTECSKHNGTDYYWCYSDIDKWDYCGLQSLDNDCLNYKLVLNLPSRQKRGNGAGPGSCKRKVADSGNRRVTEWYVENNEKILADKSRDILNDATTAISKLKSDQVSGKAHTIIMQPKVRIDLQGYSGNHEYANLQVQVNRNRRGPGDSTTIAVALIQVNEEGAVPFPSRYIRDCLLVSLGMVKKQCRLIQKSKV